MMSNRDENQLATKLRLTYQFERHRLGRQLFDQDDYWVPRQWDLGLPRRQSARGTSVWHRIVRACSEVDAAVYTRRFLNPLRVFRAGFPEPNELANLGSVTDVAAEIAKEAAALRETTARQRRDAKTLFSFFRVTGDDVVTAWVRVIVDRSRPLPPLVRFALAQKINKKRKGIADSFLDGAVWQFLRNPPAYQAVFAEFAFMRTFPGKAGRRYEQMIRDHDQARNQKSRTKGGQR